MKWTIRFGHVCFWIYIILAVLWYRERVLFVDSAWQLFKLLNYEALDIEAGRYAAILPKLIPWLLVQSGAPLQLIAISFSISYILIYYACYTIAAHLFRSQTAAVLMVLILVFGIRISFFHIVTETHQALVYCALFWGWLEWKSSNTSYNGLPYSVSGILIILLAFFSHPIALLVLIFSMVFHLIHSVRVNNRIIAGLSLTIIVLMIWKLFFSSNSGYEESFLTSFTTIPEFLMNNEKPFSIWFISANPDLYKYFALAGLAVSIIYFYHRTIRKWIVWLALTLLMSAVLILTYRSPDSNFMMERALMPVSFFVLLPLIKSVISTRAISVRVRIFLFTAMFAISLYGISIAHSTMQKRTNYLLELCQLASDQNISKGLIKWDSSDHSTINVPWALSIETLLLSSLDYQVDPASIYLLMPGDSLDTKDLSPHTFLSAHFADKMTHDQLNTRYFRIGEAMYSFLNL